LLSPIRGKPKAVILTVLGRRLGLFGHESLQQSICLYPTPGVGIEAKELHRWYGYGDVTAPRDCEIQSNGTGGWLNSNANVLVS
jgi:hypothetical protein